MKIGFSIEAEQDTPDLVLPVSEPPRAVRSLVQVRFEGDGRVLTYYNDRFNLRSSLSGAFSARLIASLSFFVR